MTTARLFTHHPPRFALVGTLALVLVLAACSPAASSPAESAAESAAGSGGGCGGNVISLAGSAFDPDTITISAGDSVEFNNNDSRQHRIAEGENGAEVDDPAFEALSLAAGESGDVTFDEPGTYQVTCTIHSSMQMTVVVE
jgi:plastocyanin